MVQYKDFENFCMGTNVIQRISSSNANEISRLAESELKRLEGLMSFYLSSSEICRLNLEAGQDEILLSKETFEVIKKLKFTQKFAMEPLI